MNKHQILIDKLGGVANWIQGADSKANYILSFNAALFGFITWMIGGQNSVNDLIVFLVSGFVVTFSFSTYKAFRVLLPNIGNKNSQKNYWFFGSISKMSFKEYSKWVENLVEAELIRELTAQIHINSIIASKKYAFLQDSWIGLIMAFIMALALLCVMQVGSIS